MTTQWQPPINPAPTLPGLRTLDGTPNSAAPYDDPRFGLPNYLDGGNAHSSYGGVIPVDGGNAISTYSTPPIDGGGA